MKIRPLILLFATSLLVACSAKEPDHQYAVDIRWTSYGIPHVLAKDWGSLGYGSAYAAAVDSVCVFAREMSTANGTLSADFGPTDENFVSDVFHRSILTEERLEHHRSALTPEVIAYNLGYIDGYNRYLRDHEGQLPASCNGKEWVRPLSDGDLDRMVVAFGIRYGLGFFKGAIVAAAPPGTAAENVASIDVPEMGIGSNAIAVGSSLTASGRGLLLGNPHYPWHGPSRFHIMHLTIPGTLDIMGARLMAGNFIGVGFNKDVAWTHTVSTAARFTLFELELNPDNPMQYRHGDQYLDIKAITVGVPGAGEDSQHQGHTVYMTHYGPLVVTEQLPWSVEKAYAIRDAIVDNNGLMPTYTGLQSAQSVADIEKAISHGGTFFVNTIAADRHGNAFYGDLSATPNLSSETISTCWRQVDGISGRAVVLDGSDPACDWKVDARSAIVGNMPANDMPRATSTGYFTNSNDSYWLSNPDAPLEGYSSIIGDERTPRSHRTRAGLTFMQEALADGAKLTSGDIQNILFSHRHFSAELFLDDVLTVCEGAGDEIAASCDVLASWDRTAGVDSRGTHIWTEFWEQARGIPNLYAVPFDVADPVNTPRGLAIDSPEVSQALSAALAAAQAKLAEKGIPLDVRWGDVQFAERNGERIGIPGGVGHHGVFSYIVTSFTDGKGYTPIVHGNSYIQVIGWDEDGNLDARGILTYSQSPEPDSPHYADQTKLYSRGEWVDFPFTEEEILADPSLETLSLYE
ncbi:MAG TPA: penicillin acylase family protein [Woeseiaceae bacterium]|nr:penicillin acylase family protein [Woeseiaceae bacterium]